MIFGAVVNATIELVAYRRLRIGAAPGGADHRRRDVVHRAEHLARGLRRELPQRAAADLGSQRVLDRRGPLQLAGVLRDPRDRARAPGAELARQELAPGQGDARDLAGHRGLGDDGDQRQPDDLLHVPARGRARRDRRGALPRRVQHPLRHRLRARPDRVHRSSARRDRQPHGRCAGRGSDRADPGLQRRALLVRARQRLDPLDRLRAPDRDPRLPARGAPRRTHAGGRRSGQASRSRADVRARLPRPGRPAQRPRRRGWPVAPAAPARADLHAGGRSAGDRGGLPVLPREPAVGERAADLLVPVGPLRRHDPRLHDDGGRAQRRRRLLRAARSRLCRLLRDRRLHRGLARLGPVPAGQVPLRVGRDQPRRARDPHLDLARAPDVRRRSPRWAGS